MPPQNQAQAAPMPALPFVAAAHEHVEPFIDVTVTPGTATSLQGPFDVPAYGYLRHVWLLVEGSGGVIGAGVLHPDFPFNIFTEVTLLDVNGAPLFGPMDGFSTFLVNLYGGYAFDGDPRNHPDYVATINMSFAVRIPVEISHHDGLGSLAAQNAAANYKVRLGVNIATGPTGLFTTAPTTVPAVRIRGYGEYWSLPADRSLSGVPQQTEPPRHGTAQFWTLYPRTIAATGAQTIQVARVGNLIRTIILVQRDNTANVARVTAANMPDPVELRWDARQQSIETRKYRRAKIDESIVGAQIDGTYVWSFDTTMLGHVGDGSPALWLPTVQSTRLEFALTFAVAGTLQIIVNDVAPAEVDQSKRYIDSSQTGFHPAQFVGAPVVQ